MHVALGCAIFLHKWTKHENTVPEVYTKLRIYQHEANGFVILLRNKPIPGRCAALHVCAYHEVVVSIISAFCTEAQ